MNLNPITREEKFLAKAGGEDIGELKPITRKEKFLNRLAGSSGGGGGVFYVQAEIPNLFEEPTFTTPFEDIVEAYNSGKTIMCRVDFMGNNAHASLINKTKYGFSFGIMASMDMGNGIIPVMGMVAYNIDETPNQLQLFPLATTTQVEELLGGIANGTY